LGNKEQVIRLDPKTREVELNRSGGSKLFSNEAFKKLGVFKQWFLEQPAVNCTSDFCLTKALQSCT